MFPSCLNITKLRERKEECSLRSHTEAIRTSCRWAPSEGSKGETASSQHPLTQCSKTLVSTRQPVQGTSTKALHAQELLHSVNSPCPLSQRGHHPYRQRIKVPSLSLWGGKVVISEIGSLSVSLGGLEPCYVDQEGLESIELHLLLSPTHWD